jgi:rare lipoprotein A
MKSATKALLATLALVPCAPAFARTPEPVVAPYGPEADYPVTIGDPYVIGGVSYSPSDTLNYDAVGYAHAGTEGSGISGAHHTLPLPCYVEVTALDSGHTILLRLDRRGPMSGKQLIELSPAAWAQLGLTGTSDVAVRVRRVNPPETERAKLRTGNRAPDRMDTPPGLLTALRRKLGVATPRTPDEPPSATLSGAGAPGTAGAKPIAQGLPATSKPVMPAATKPVAAPPPTKAPPVAPKAAVPASPAPKPPETKVAPPKIAPKVEAKPEPKPAPKPIEPVHAATAHVTVQVAAFSTREHAEKAAAQVGGKVEPAGKLWRVRIPAGSEDQAKAALAKAKQAGYAGAMILHHD